MPARHLRGAAAALALAALPAVGAAGPLENMVEICADPDRSPAEALKFCQNAMEHRSMDRQPPGVRARVLLNAGIAAYELGRFSEAADSHTRALDNDPTLGAAHAGRARAYERMGRRADALADYNAAVRYSPNDANVFLGRGVLRLAERDVRGALEDFDRAVQLEPDWTAPYYNRGVALSLLGEFARAERDFSTVLSRHPDDAQALVNRGKARTALGDRGAGADFDQALRLRPEWGAGWYARAEYFDMIGQREAANADYLRAYQLGHSDPKLIERVQGLGGG